MFCPPDTPDERRTTSRSRRARLLDAETGVPSGEAICLFIIPLDGARAASLPSGDGAEAASLLLVGLPTSLTRLEYQKTRPLKGRVQGPRCHPSSRLGELSERSNGRYPARAGPAAHPGGSTLSSIRPLPPVSHQHRLAQAVANLLLRFTAVYVGGVYRFDNAGVNFCIVQLCDFVSSPRLQLRIEQA